MSWFDKVAKVIGPEDPAVRRAAAEQAKKHRASSQALFRARAKELEKEIADLKRSIDPKCNINHALHRPEIQRAIAQAEKDLAYVRSELR